MCMSVPTPRASAMSSSRCRSVSGSSARCGAPRPGRPRVERGVDDIVGDGRCGQEDDLDGDQPGEFVADPVDRAHRTCGSSGPRR